MASGELWAAFALAFAALAVAAVWFIRRDAQKGVHLVNKNEALKATAKVRAIRHAVSNQDRRIVNDFLRDRLR